MFISLKIHGLKIFNNPMTNKGKYIYSLEKERLNIFIPFDKQRLNIFNLKEKEELNIFIPLTYKC